MGKDKIIAALVVFTYAVCTLGPIVELARLGRGAFGLLVAGLAVFGLPAMLPYIKTLTGRGDDNTH